MTDTKLVVLAVDDTPSNLDLLHGALNEDYKVKVATNGEKALELAVKEPRPDIILLDVMMPGMSGHDVCRVLKQNPETTPIPVVFVTAMSETKDEMLAAWMRELMKRHVIRTAVIYFSTAWALTASGTMIARSLQAPAWVGQAMAIAFVADLPVVVLLSWVYDVRATDQKSPASSLNRKRTYWLVAALVLLSAVIITLYSLYG